MFQLLCATYCGSGYTSPPRIYQSKVAMVDLANLPSQHHIGSLIEGQLDQPHDQQHLCAPKHLESIFFTWENVYEQRR